ncbi:MAG TPA: DNA mismatch repair endonuclease MutL [Gemmatimonadaceae bacterium]|nr:DNA mismatch repair endonuclease MutL [Gemmatimonadaceae bacterium]
MSATPDPMPLGASRIAILPSAVADQIAAGEVVERPASVVKELIENALDAGAGSLDVDVEEGGRQRIRVSDDGWGMGRDDAVLALARHATSKIRAASDLVGVASFGFRGEALPAICSVSHLEIETAAADGGGTRVRAAGGTVLDTADAARRRGTTVTVAHLFYNAPARLKFMRGPRSEWRAIVDAITSIALTRRDVRLTLHHDGKRVMALPPASSLRARLAALWGGTYAERFLEVDDVSGSTRVSGLVERPADVGIAGRRVFVSVNGRAVRDPGIVRAAEAAFKSTIPAGVRPTLFLDVEVAADAVDVNVHPAKAEVRFRDRWPVERAVEAAVRRALGTIGAGAVIGRPPIPFPAAPRDAFSPVDVEALRREPPAPDGLFADAQAERAEPAPPVEREPEDAEPIPPLVQLRRTYLMFEGDGGVVLIDQHSAHERVLYEAFMGALTRGEAPAQHLLFPITLHLGPAEAEAFEQNRAAFEQLGFEIEGFGGHTLIVRSVPMPHPRFDPERCLRETLDALTGDRFAAVAQRHERLAATIACKAAIKAGDALSPGEMRALFVDLRRTTLPAHDVHGRSTVVLLSWDELERRFGRK